ncbi:hypothetical protein DL93DRAFT_2091294 [Clavulina sp. PMI_390]|nr:hypothetical protein DL93DRAFT_2091294 [Clavulina sp. PMI_390]
MAISMNCVAVLFDPIIVKRQIVLPDGTTKLNSRLTAFRGRLLINKGVSAVGVFTVYEEYLCKITAGKPHMISAKIYPWSVSFTGLHGDLFLEDPQYCANVQTVMDYDYHKAPPPILNISGIPTPPSPSSAHDFTVTTILSKTFLSKNVTVKVDAQFARFDLRKNDYNVSKMASSFIHLTCIPTALSVEKNTLFTCEILEYDFDSRSAATGAAHNIIPILPTTTAWGDRDDLPRFAEVRPRLIWNDSYASSSKRQSSSPPLLAPSTSKKARIEYPGSAESSSNKLRPLVDVIDVTDTDSELSSEDEIITRSANRSVGKNQCR